MASMPNSIYIYSDVIINIIWTTSSEFGTYRICEQRRFRRACASAQSRQNLRCSLIQAMSQEEPSDRKPDSWPFWMAGHAQLKFVMTECSKTQIRLTGLISTDPVLFQLIFLAIEVDIIKANIRISRGYLVWFLFYGPSTHFRSFWARSVTLTTLFLGKHLKSWRHQNLIYICLHENDTSNLVQASVYKNYYAVFK